MDLEDAIRQLLQNSQGQENDPKSEGASSDTGTGAVVPVDETAVGAGGIKTISLGGSTDDLTAEVAVKMEGLLTLEMIKEMKEKKGANKVKVVKPRSRKGSEADAQDNWRVPNNNLNQNDNNNPADHSNNNNFGFAGSTGTSGRRLRRYGSGDHSGAEDDQNDENKWGFFGKKNFERNAKKLAAKSAAVAAGDEGENENAFEHDGPKCIFEKKKSFNFTDEPSLNYAIRQPRGPDVGGGIGFAVRRQLADKDLENIP